MGTVAAKCGEEGRYSDADPSLEQCAHRLAMIAGTSTCHLVQVGHSHVFLSLHLPNSVQNPKRIFVKGVWGPYQVIEAPYL
jgi:ribulose kinase